MEMSAAGSEEDGNASEAAIEEHEEQEADQKQKQSVGAPSQLDIGRPQQQQQQGHPAVGGPVQGQRPAPSTVPQKKKKRRGFLSRLRGVFPCGRKEEPEPEPEAEQAGDPPQSPHLFTPPAIQPEVEEEEEPDEGGEGPSEQAAAEPEQTEECECPREQDTRRGRPPRGLLSPPSRRRAPLPAVGSVCPNCGKRVGAPRGRRHLVEETVELGKADVLRWLTLGRYATFRVVRGSPRSLEKQQCQLVFVDAGAVRPPVAEVRLLPPSGGAQQPLLLVTFQAPCADAAPPLPRQERLREAVLTRLGELAENCAVPHSLSCGVVTPSAAQEMSPPAPPPPWRLLLRRRSMPRRSSAEPASP
eukprot:TRINITY_DN3140_c1_g1_i16.p1 TRINITY_DN3140_c1_g1~~TRINITY_DN3140_c1_g1_i16.p1  ORF type:complete len:358 (+),score=88.38 TRINITY_DN3140_c1_g1_i16:78-1151(+)